jgi:hypothetical protein
MLCPPTDAPALVPERRLFLTETTDLSGTSGAPLDIIKASVSLTSLELFILTVLPYALSSPSTTLLFKLTVDSVVFTPATAAPSTFNVPSFITSYESCGVAPSTFHIMPSTTSLNVLGSLANTWFPLGALENRTNAALTVASSATAYRLNEAPNETPAALNPIRKIGWHEPILFNIQLLKK